MMPNKATNYTNYLIIRCYFLIYILCKNILLKPLSIKKQNCQPINLKNKENELISIDDERTKKLNGELATIAKNINDEAIKTEFKIMNFYNKYNSENHKLWNKEEFLKQFKVYNYKKHYNIVN